jgi:hypothetical protein
MRHLTASLLCTALALWAAAPARAENECRSVKTVTASAAGWKQNLALLGHIHKHIKDLRTEVGKTQFASETELKTAFTAWQNRHLDPNKKFKAKTCNVNGGGMDCVLASDVGITQGYRCTSLKQPEQKLNKQQQKALEKTEGEGEFCATWDQFTPTHVGFNYAWEGEKKKQWILNTAYPSEDENCH